MRRHLVLLTALLLLAAFALALPAGRVVVSADEPPFWQLYLPVVANPPPTPTYTPTLTPSATPTATETLTPSPTPTETQTFTPSPTATATVPVTPSLTPTITPTPTPSPTRDPTLIEWDPRLDQRGAVIQPAQVQAGQWYWRLVKGVWYDYDEQPFKGNHNIYVDIRTAEDARKAGVPVRFTSLDGGTVWDTRLTEPRPDCNAPGSSYPGCLYATDFAMYALAPAYRAVPADGNPADAVTNLGYGNIEHPELAFHTSYLFVWQWSQALATSPAPLLGPPSTPAHWQAPWPWRAMRATP